MHPLIITLIIFYILSIIFFFIENGVRERTLKQIIQLDSRKLENSKFGCLIFIPNFSHILLVSCIPTLVIYLHRYCGYELVIIFLVGIFGFLVITCLQKIIILLLQKMIAGLMKYRQSSIDKKEA